MSMSRIKAGVRRGLAAVYHRSEQFTRCIRGKTMILTYHRVLSPS